MIVGGIVGDHTTIIEGITRTVVAQWVRPRIARRGDARVIASARVRGWNRPSTRGAHTECAHHAEGVVRPYVIIGVITHDIVIVGGTLRRR